MSFSSNSDLPPEIWCQIFSFLSTDDRLNVRLTCCHFYELCNEIQVQRPEEFVFHGNLNTSSALQLLSSSPRIIRNIRFYHVHIEETLLPYFEKNGGNIHSLSLKRCNFEPRSFKSLLEQCTALRSLVLEMPFICKEMPNQRVFRDIQAMSKNSITFEQVVNIKLHVRGVSSMDEISPRWTNQLLLQFLALFPSVKRLDLKFDVIKSFDHLSRIPSDIASDNQFNASCIYDRILALRNQLEQLRLHLYSTKCAYEYTTNPLAEKIKEIEMTNLKELSLNFRDNLRSLTTKPLRTFENLTHIHCDFSSCLRPNIFPSTEIHFLLNTIPGLRSLAYTYSDLNGCKPFSRACFEALLKSRLTRLKLGSYTTTHFKEFSLQDTFQPNYLLKRLSIDTLSNDVLLLFASHFRSLEHVTFSKVGKKTLHTIFNIQTNLRSLRLYNGKCSNLLRENRKFTNYTGYKRFLRNDNLSQNRILPHLTHLHINENEIDLTKFLLTEFKFPLLKSLTICLQRIRDNFEELLKILTHIRQVRFLQLHCIRALVPSDKLLRMVRRLPNLCHLAIRDTISDHGDRPDISEYHQLFNVRSSLRTVSHRFIKYFYDTTTGHIREISLISSGGFCEGIPPHYEYEPPILIEIQRYLEELELKDDGQMLLSWNSEFQLILAKIG
ncbi:hypothetical protein ACFE04_003758 [Oxalis oulophora]